MWTLVVVAVLIVAFVAICGTLMSFEDRDQRRRINKLILTLECPACHGRIDEWRGAWWESSFHGSGALLRCSQCEKEIYLNNEYRIFEPEWRKPARSK